VAWRGVQAIDDIGAGVATTIPYAGSQAAPGESLPGGWHPTVGYMIAFVIGEMFLYTFLSKHLNII
jgi:hypothetical protein